MLWPVPVTDPIGYLVMRQRREDPAILYWLAMFDRAEADEKVERAAKADPGARYFVAAVVEATDG